MRQELRFYPSKKTLIKDIAKEHCQRALPKSIALKTLIKDIVKHGSKNIDKKTLIKDMA